MGRCVLFVVLVAAVLGAPLLPEGESPPSQVDMSSLMDSPDVSSPSVLPLPTHQSDEDVPTRVVDMEDHDLASAIMDPPRTTESGSTPVAGETSGPGITTMESPPSRSDKDSLPAVPFVVPSIAAAVDTNATQMIDVAIVIPTVRRFTQDGSPAPERYLAPLVHKLWDDMTAEQRTHVHFFILNSDKEPEKHLEALSLNDHPGVTLFTKSNEKDFLVQQAAESSQLEDGREVSVEWMSWVASENVDGAFLFEKTRTTAPYILFLEDDVLPTTHALAKLSEFVHGFTHDDWLFLDLYTPNLNWGEGMLDYKNGEEYPFQCCTQSMLFRSDRVSGVIDYWREHAREPVDDNLRNYVANMRPDLKIYALRPNLFEHVGAYSSNPQKSYGVVEHTSLEFVPLLVQTAKSA